jgi:hypothetical protein
MPEYFGPEYVRPRAAACMNCGCCTRELCELGRATVLGCAGNVGDEDRVAVAGCPCSSETAYCSLAWRAVRVRAVTMATERPVPASLEALLRAVADGDVLGEVGEGLSILETRKFVDLGPGSPRCTEYGRLYLVARREPRQATAVIVHDVDERARTARVIVVGRSTTRVITVPMDVLANGHTRLAPGGLAGATLYAQANTAAVYDDDVVLTQVRNPALSSFRDMSSFSAYARAARRPPAQGGGR